MPNAPLVSTLPWTLDRSDRRASHNDPPDTLVENRTSYGGEDMQFSVYDTVQQAQRVALRSANPLYCGMITGKKVIHLTDPDREPFEFLPGESLVVPPLETIYIDFPEADREPTRCITLEIDSDKVDDMVARLNEEMPRSPESGPWEVDRLNHCHLRNDAGIERVLQSLVQLFTEDVPHRDMLIDLNATELVVRLLQTESRHLLMGPVDRQLPENGLAAAIQYARKHLDQPLTVSELAEKACMSESSFYRYFRNELGMTPLQFLTKERMKRACELLLSGSRSVGEVSHDIGFSSVSYFINTFKEHVGTTPKQFQLSNR
ncbi:helix-turn-helix transcriptional regulator [Longibacter salinarum]|nr:helix-turn-helix domain-containing protein [Longibacter salinarum]